MRRSARQYSHCLELHHAVGRDVLREPVFGQHIIDVRNHLAGCKARLMGIEPPLDLPPFKLTARYEAVGNGVPLPMGRTMALAIRRWLITREYVR